MTGWIDEDMRDQAVEHECPTPLRVRADEFTAGGMVFTPAGRWETVTEVGRTDLGRVMVRTDRAGWTLSIATEWPYLAAWEIGTGLRRVAVVETDSTITVDIVGAARFRGEHTLLTAARSRGSGWVIWDRPDGATSEQVTVESRAKARTEIRRRARAHAKRLGLPLADDSGRGGGRG